MDELESTPAAFASRSRLTPSRLMCLATDDCRRWTGYLLLMLSTIPSPIGWGADETIRILDQTLLPEEERYLELRTLEELAEAIRSLRVRGAPLIGIAAAMGVAMAAGKLGSGDAGKRGLLRIREA